MKITTTIAALLTSVALTACATSNVGSDATKMKEAKMMDAKHAMKDGKMMKDAKMMDGKHAMKDGKMMKDAKMMDGKHAMKDGKIMKDAKMMKGESCHDHSANSMTKSSSHCHKSSQASHSHKYGG